MGKAGTGAPLGRRIAALVLLAVPLVTGGIAVLAHGLRGWRDDAVYRRGACPPAACRDADVTVVERTGAAVSVEVPPRGPGSPPHRRGVLLLRAGALEDAVAPGLTVRARLWRGDVARITVRGGRTAATSGGPGDTAVVLTTFGLFLLTGGAVLVLGLWHATRASRLTGAATDACGGIFFAAMALYFARLWIDLPAARFWPTLVVSATIVALPLHRWPSWRAMAPLQSRTRSR